MNRRNRKTDASKRVKTSLDRPQLQEQGGLGIRRVTLALVSDASAAALRLGRTAAKHDSKSARAEDALHDFRVAIRRLRSWSRAFRRPLRGSISGNQRRQLRVIFHATATARDAMVHLRWIREQRKSLDASGDAGHAWLKRRLKARRRTGWITALSAAKRLERMRPGLVSGLRDFRCLKEDKPLSRTGLLIGRKLIENADELERSLVAIESASDERPIHRARINAKRLRYVAEIIAAMVEDGNALIESLEHLQDMLGDLHDVHVLAAELRNRSAKKHAKSTRARKPGIRALHQRLRERRTLAFAPLEATWLHGRAGPFFSRAHEMAREIARIAEVRSPERPRVRDHARRRAADTRRYTRPVT